MNIKETLFSLSNAVNVGNLHEASDIAFDILSKYAETERKDNLTVIGKIKGESDYTIMLDAHLDEVAFVVTDVDDKGFLTVAKCGGIDLRTLPARVVTVHGKEKIPAVFCSTPPHLSSGEKEYTDIGELKLDTCLGSSAKDIISVGDYVTYRQKATALNGNIVTGKSFDDRAGVVCLLELAERLSYKKLPVSVSFVLCDWEELGLRGSKIASFEVNPDEAVAIDVSFGDGPDISPDECGNISGGAMIGVSPVLCREISDKLFNIAKEKGILHQAEIMGGKTGTDGDVISTTQNGVKTGLVSIPLRNMHTDVELIDIKDIESICDILEQYILSGGVSNG
ncbi:MAG: M42 family peptidase [Clostridia bacterium]|nr:M42 family peptidase [Clostridia bacterium]MEE1185301.1 M42 family peptidase [Acutalibacteraceae bacterium]